LILKKKANLPKDFEAIAKIHAVKAYSRFCLDEGDSFEDELNHYVVVKLAILSHRGICFFVHIKHGIATGNECAMMVCK